MLSVLVINSLDARYGSTYRLRAIANYLENSLHCSVCYVEHSGSALSKLKATVSASLGTYDIIMTQKFNPITLSALLISGLKNIPAIVDWDDFDEGLQKSKIKKWLAYTCESWGPPLASVITTHSPLISLRAAKHKPVFMLPQGFDPAVFYPDPKLRELARKELKLSRDEVLIGHMCTFTSGGAIDLETILEAFSKVESTGAKFILIGGGPLEKSVQQKLRSLGLSERVYMTGLLPQEKVAHYLRALDIGVVFMSDQLSNRSRASFKVIEYLAMNVPIVGQVVGETFERFSNYIQTADQENLARCIDHMCKTRPQLPTHDIALPYAWNKSLKPLEAALNHVKPKMEYLV